MAQRTCDVEGCEKVHRARGLCLMHWKREHGTPTRYARTCCVCDAVYQSARPDGRFCSDVCKGKAYQVENRTRSRGLVGPVEHSWCELPERHPARQCAPRARTWYAGTCGWCAAPFIDSQPAARFCSVRCGKMAGKAKRGRFIVPPHIRLAIYERDGWVCQLCMEPVTADLMTTDPCNDWAPSLDHIECQAWALVPDHSPSNLRLAHRWCNAVRGNERWYTESDLRISYVA